MLNGDLPENTPQTEAGTKVKLPDEWKIGTPNYIETEEGQMVITSKQIATVQAVSVENGETVLVPIGFYYVGGDLSSGVVISDNIADQNKYVGQREVPSGIEKKLSEDGSLKRTLQGNQFVWIPCEYEGYTKTNFGQGNIANRSSTCWDTTVDEIGKVQTKKYGGFYVGRFEVGLATNIEEHTTAETYKSKIYNKEGIPQSRAGEIPWNFIDWTHAEKNAENMYNTGIVNSGIIIGTQWDVMMNKIETSDSTKSLTDIGTWANCYDTVITEYVGRYATLNMSNVTLSTFSSEIQTSGTKNANSSVVLTTGASDKTRAYNIYDVAGNLWEWTKETSFGGGNSETQYRVLRGGYYAGDSVRNPVCYRYGVNNISYTESTMGFRVVLYIK